MVVYNVLKMGVFTLFNYVGYCPNCFSFYLEVWFTNLGDDCFKAWMSYYVMYLIQSTGSYVAKCPKRLDSEYLPPLLQKWIQQI